MRLRLPRRVKAQRAERIAGTDGCQLEYCNKVEANSNSRNGKGSNKNAAAIVMAIEMKVAASWPIGQLSCCSAGPFGQSVCW